MDILFECNSIQTKENLLELAKVFMARKLTLEALVFPTIALAFLIWAVIYDNSDHILVAVVLSLACIVFVSYRYFNVPKKYAQQIYEMNIKMYNDAAHTQAQFSDVMIRNNNYQSRSFKTFEYKEIARLIESDHLFLLVTCQRSVIMLAKDGFSIGEAARFSEFMKSKSPGMKITLNQKKGIGFFAVY